MLRQPSGPIVTALFATLLAGVATLAPLAAAAAAADAAYPPEHAATRELMDLVGDAAALISEKGVDGACAELRQADSRWFHGETYVFVNDMVGNSLCHPAKPSLEGRTLLDLRDPHGKPIVQSFLREVKEDGEGWVHYLWPRPGAGMTFHWKTSYVRVAETPDGGEVIVGSGVYQMPMERMFVVEQVDDAAALLRDKGEEAFPVLRDEASGFLFYDSYVFVMDESGVHLVNAGFPQREGQNMLDFADEDGKVVGREMQALLETKEAGWVEYMWPRPGDEPASRKASYVRKVTMPDGRTVVVGAGLYVE
jgi:signal transduction histidine kinase